MLDKLDQPSLRYDEAEIKQAIFVHKNVCTLYVNRSGQADLLWKLWWLAVEAPVFEDVNISTKVKGKTEKIGTPISYCEMYVPDRPGSSWKYRPENDDFMVCLSRYDAELAFVSLQQVGRVNCKEKRVRLLDNVWVERVNDDEWARMFATIKGK